MTVIGLTFAKACSQPGNVATGTNMELVKITGMTARSPPMPADSASRTTSPSSAKIQEKATPTAREADSGQRRARAGVEAEADRVPQAGHQHQYEQVAERVGGDGAGQDGAAGHRQGPELVDHAGRQILGERDARLRRAERDGQNPDAGRRVVDVPIDARGNGSLLPTRT
ncbi:MAG TPA: hypothetical protein VGQ92_24170 [Actinoplanes sp.]|nr:hypothetical protein [Actinoplanes sp.]